eukprot:170076-Pyramimonas_sp.AAC.1
MVFRYLLALGGASLERKVGHETLSIAWCSDTLLALAGPPWRGGRGKAPCKQYCIPKLSCSGAASLEGCDGQ